MPPPIVQHHDVRLFDPSTTRVTALAGARDMPGFAGGVEAAARFSSLYDVVVMGDHLVVTDQDNHRLRAVTLDGRGNLYVSDLDGHVVRRVAPDGTVTTVAGAGATGFADGPPLALAPPVAVGLLGLVVHALPPKWKARNTTTATPTIGRRAITARTIPSSVA